MILDYLTRLGIIRSMISINIYALFRLRRNIQILVTFTSGWMLVLRQFVTRPTVITYIRLF